MLLECLVFLGYGLNGVFSLKGCNLHKKWTPETDIGLERRFVEIYRPWNPTNFPLVYFVTTNEMEYPYLFIQRKEYHPKDRCHDFNWATWHRENMSFIETEGCSIHFDWESLLIYFNENRTIGVLTECSRAGKTRHVLWHSLKGQRTSSKELPSKEDVQDLVMHFEGEMISFNEISEDNLTFNYPDLSKDCEFCNAPRHTFNPIDYSNYVVLAVFLLVTAIAICYAYWK